MPKVIESIVSDGFLVVAVAAFGWFAKTITFGYTIKARLDALEKAMEDHHKSLIRLHKRFDTLIDDLRKEAKKDGG